MKIEDYVLRIRAGPNKQTLVTVNVNDEMSPLLIDGPYMSGYLLVRMNNFNGICQEQSARIQNPASPYFNGKNRKYSLTLQCAFKQSYDGDEILFGVDMDTPLRAPLAANLGIRIAQWLDPNIFADLNAGNPYLWSPFVSAMNSVCVLERGNPLISTPLSDAGNIRVVACTTEHLGEYLNGDAKDTEVSLDSANGEDECVKIGEADESVKQDGVSDSDPNTNREETIVTRDSFSTSASASDYYPHIGHWGFHTEAVMESSENLLNPPLPTLKKDRKKYFSTAKNRKSAQFTTGNVYGFDFYDAYLDYQTLRVTLPGFSLDLFKYWDEQPMRYSARTRDGKRTFFVVEFGLERRID